MVCLRFAVAFTLHYIAAIEGCVSAACMSGTMVVCGNARGTRDKRAMRPGFASGRGFWRHECMGFKNEKKGMCG